MENPISLNLKNRQDQKKLIFTINRMLLVTFLHPHNVALTRKFTNAKLIICAKPTPEPMLINILGSMMTKKVTILLVLLVAQKRPLKCGHG